MIALLVGGAVRDRLLGLAVTDLDYVVIGSTPEQMIAAGFMPVGKDFPVFIDPVSKSEYALARTERKVAAGYHGFAFQTDAGVTIEQDLLRRDLTINAMAQATDGTLIDPYGGQQDLRNKVLRHVSDTFIQDPVRILRLARFAARFTDFNVASETMQLMQRMVSQGEVDALVAERVWQEISRGLIEAQPSKMFAVLSTCGALIKVAPELTLNDAVLTTIDRAAKCDLPAPAKLILVFACLTLATAQLEPLCERLRVPSECADMAILLQRERGTLNKADQLSAADLVHLLMRCDAFRKPDRFKQMLSVLKITASPEIATSPEDTHALAKQLTVLDRARLAAGSVRSGDIAAAVTMKSKGLGTAINLQIKDAVFTARVDSVNAAINLAANAVKKLQP